MNTYGNKQVENLPQRLRRFVVDQHYEKYTAVNQAVWRYVMRQNWYYLKDAAYYPYIRGLKRAGLSTDFIPNLQVMNDHLAEIGWGAVTVDGFIPPAAFMEFQSLAVLVIASDIRQLHHIEYTPAPDIIHESAGHAPIIADKAYAEYLRYFGEIGTKAIFSKGDFELYEAVRELSILKELPEATGSDIEQASLRVKEKQENLGEPSEMALLSRLHWWTVEYGLIGTLDNPKIYGAGLLSSIGESVNCMTEAVGKLPYTLDAVRYPFDITSQQPQLFVTPDFKNLVNVLEEFAGSMAFKTGGVQALKKAADNQNVCTLVLETGLQISGVLASFRCAGEHPVWIDMIGPCAFAFSNKELPDLGRSSFPQGISFPLGPANNDVEAKLHQRCTLNFESGFLLTGTLERVISEQGTLVMLVFSDVSLVDSREDEIKHFQTFYLPYGVRVTSVFNGAADKEAFEDFPPIAKSTTAQSVTTGESRMLDALYTRVREVREHRGTDNVSCIWQALKAHAGEKKMHNTWLCAIELLEILSHTSDSLLYSAIERALNDFVTNHPSYGTLVENGKRLLAFKPMEEPIAQ